MLQNIYTIIIIVNKKLYHVNSEIFVCNNYVFSHIILSKISRADLKFEVLITYLPENFCFMCLFLRLRRVLGGVCP